ncbi:helix-turn-helix domain-containing protein [Streptomyces montanisoli]|uniref:Helix-turn-helix transcriptional regulator n=1 Tax=Streptomyces montanisoli TaxID=2798581 RepID=A0A940MHL6_9ACTN|nr:helix-turn-helix transcriptional regulator [Streptomyces montanisoli]MBP0459792.1 helix-turn-helix transcriptional regulator [Streptomyces montanisoli]
MTTSDKPSMFPRPRFGWEFFGSELRRRREAAGLKQQELGDRAYCSGSYIGQFEQAIRKPQLELAQRFDEVLGTDGYFGRMCEELINRTGYEKYFAQVQYLEGLAAALCEYGATFVPGLLQTPEYARSLFLAAHPDLPEATLQQWGEARTSRAQLLENPAEPTYWAIVSEAVLRHRCGGSTVMEEQLRHIMALIRRRRIVVQVLPFSAGAPPLAATLKLMAFSDAPPVAYHEAQQVGLLIDDPATVHETEQAYNLARSAALSPQESLALIESVAEEYAHEV